MSNHVQPKANKAKTSFTVSMKHGQIHLNRCGRSNVNRLLSVTKLPDESLSVTLLAFQGDVWRFTSNAPLDLGPEFSIKARAPIHRYFYIDEQGELKDLNSASNPMHCEDSKFSRVSMTNSLTNMLYRDVIGFLTNDTNIVHVTCNEPFNLRDMSKERDTHFSGASLNYLVDAETRNASVMNVTETSTVLQDGIKEDKFVVRQAIRDSNAIMLNLPGDSEERMGYLLEELVAEYPYIDVTRVKNRYNINLNEEKYLHVKKAEYDLATASTDAAVSPLSEVGEKDNEVLQETTDQA